LKTKVLILFSIIVPSLTGLVAQVFPGGNPDSIPKQGDLPIYLDSAFTHPNSFSSPTDTSKVDLKGVEISDDALDSKVEYDAQDSMFFDIKNKQIHLYGQAVVKYLEMTIEAEHMVIDWKNSTITAEGRKGFKGKIIGKPKFTQKDQTFNAGRLRYNYQTSKGIIYDGRTMQQGMNVIGTKTKFVGAGKDTTRDDVIFNSNSIFSTCDLEHPHFGIRGKKQKIIPNKVAIIGPSNLEIAGVPTPIWLPFAFVPLKKGKRTGLIFPRDYEFSEQWGFGLRNMGWFFPISDEWDLTATGDIYFKGTFGINLSSRYRRRYKYNGSLAISFADRRSDGPDGRPLFSKSSSLRWRHNQDPKAHPTRTIGGSINIQTSSFQSVTQNDAQSVLQGSLNSTMSYRQSFGGGLYTLSASFNHSQNTRTRDVRINFPNVTFQMKQAFPFKRKIRTGKERWYEKVSLRYTGEIRNQIRAKDTTLFTKKTLEDAKYGIRHTLNTDVSFNVLKYFNISPRVNYKEVWYFNTLRKEFDPTLEINIDTIFNQDSSEFIVTIDTVGIRGVTEHQKFGFKPLRLYDFSLSVNTRIFGTIQFKKGGWLRGIRHVMQPNLSFGFTPDFSKPSLGYFRTVQTDLDSTQFEQYNIFQKGIFDKPSASGKRMALSYSITNNIEAKIYSKKDSTEKKVKLFRTLSLSGSYNFAADSLKWSFVRISGNTTFFNGMTTFRFGMTYDPYDVDSKGRRINKFYFSRTKKPLRFVESNYGFATNLTVRRIRDMIKGVNTDDRGGPQREQKKQEEEDFLSLFDRFSIAHNFTIRRTTANNRDTTIITANSVSMRGNIQLTPNWTVRVGNFGYDFQSNRVTYPDFGFTRDLHCWEMAFQWQPRRGTYTFFLHVKPGHLDFINIPYRKNNVDSRFGGF